MGKRKKLSPNGEAIQSVKEQVVSQLAAKLSKIGMVKLSEFGKDKFMRDSGVCCLICLALKGVKTIVGISYRRASPLEGT